MTIRILKKCILPMALTLLPMLALAQGSGGSDGGGGAGIMINGKFYTLAQAGLRLRRPIDNQPYSLADDDPQTVVATQNLVAKIAPQLSDDSVFKLNEAIFGEHRRYQPLEVADPTQFAKLQAQYKPYLSKTPLKGSFAPIAFTSCDEDRPSSGSDSTCSNEKTVTYLLPDFFSKATPRETRALILVTHEALFHLSMTLNIGTLSTQITLDQVLQFEIAVVDYLKSPTPDSVQEIFDALDNVLFFESTPLESNLYSGHQISTAHYIYMLAQKGIVVTLEDLVGPHPPGSDVDGTLPRDMIVDPIAIRAASKSKDKDLVRRLDRAHVVLSPNIDEGYPIGKKPKDVKLCGEKQGIRMSAVALDKNCSAATAEMYFTISRE